MDISIMKNLTSTFDCFALLIFARTSSNKLIFNSDFCRQKTSLDISILQQGTNSTGISMTEESVSSFLCIK